jgi:hypothetical protein
MKPLVSGLCGSVEVPESIGAKMNGNRIKTANGHGFTQWVPHFHKGLPVESKVHSAPSTDPSTGSTNHP